MLIPVFWCPTGLHIVLLPAVMSRSNYENSSRSPFWATVYKVAKDGGHHTSGPPLYFNINSYN